ncbi:hypothetical protein PR202_ga21406 [Eleusine coracana subsp. coracana]|uniref:Uncharacterized protein n=1 Tax=Eleusine coracana subsp. coracana TaxID=191504 RepID=A0AAV5D1I2_ELECO|nr:hypothetical protein PR202_ga21406 [Eleusine coracana subsp. coracana]
MLVELLTRKKPTVEISLDGVSLIAQFVLLLSEDRLAEILDIQVIEEGEEEAKQVPVVAALCLQMKGDNRPTMRHVEMRLQGLQCSDSDFQNNAGEQAVLTGLNNRVIRRYIGEASSSHLSSLYLLPLLFQTPLKMLVRVHKRTNHTPDIQNILGLADAGPPHGFSLLFSFSSDAYRRPNTGILTLRPADPRAADSETCAGRSQLEYCLYFVGAHTPE